MVPYNFACRHQRASDSNSNAISRTAMAKATAPPPAYGFDLVDWKEVEVIIKGHNPVGTMCSCER